MRRLLVLGAVFALLVTGLPMTASAATPGPITLDSLQFYTHLNCDGLPTVNATNPATFSSGTPVIFALAKYSQWQGQHSVKFTWVDPNGKTASTYTDTYDDSGATYDYDYLPIAWTNNAQALGTWTLQLTIDGAAGPTQTFTLHAGPVGSLHADYCAIAARVENPATKPSVPFTTSALKKVKLGKKVRYTLYYDFRNLDPSVSIKVSLQVKKSGKVVSKYNDNCASDCGNDYLGVSWTWNTFQPKATGKYTFTGTIQVGSQKQSSSTSFTVTK